MKKKVLISVFIHSQFPEMSRVASVLAQIEAFEPEFLFAGEVDFSLEIERCKSEGWKYHVHSLKVSSSQSRVSSDVTNTVDAIDHRSAGNRLVQVIKRHKNHPILKPLLRVVSFFYQNSIQYQSSVFYLPRHLKLFSGLLRQAEEILRSIHPDVVVFPNITVGNLSGMLLHACKKRATPTVLVPYAWTARIESLMALQGKRALSTHTLLGKYITKAHPHWVWKDTFFYPPSKILPLEWLKVSSQSPWMADAEADVIAAESKAMADYYAKDGIPAEKCIITGSLSHDRLSQSLKNRNSLLNQLQNELGLKAGREFILCSLPPDQTGAGISGFEFENYFQMIEFWINTLSFQKTYDVIFSLHPRMRNMLKAQDFKAKLLSLGNPLIYQGDIHDLLPLSRFFVATLSGTIRSAICSAVPVLYYDVFNYRMFLYRDVPGVYYATSKKTFLEGVDRFVGDFEFFSDLKSAQAKIAPDWGVIDGKCKSRMTQLFEGFTSC